MEGKDGSLAMAYRRGDPLINTKTPFRILSWGITWFVELIGWPAVRILYGYRSLGRKNLYRAPKGPIIYVSNHAIPLDPLLHGLSLLPNLLYYTLLEETVLTPVLGTLVRLLGGIPIPSDHGRTLDMERALAQALEARGKLHFYPEGECFLLNQEIRDFKAGAFFAAIRRGIPVQPLVTVIKLRPFLGRQRIRAEVHVLEAQQPPASAGGLIADLHEALRFAEKIQRLMQQAIDSAEGDKSLYRGPMPRIRGVNDRNR
ncbi:MAG: lysophospholipid acyltransferase family protein [Spirochaetia bacterium]|jgi:1-acyl-sn-glycerol-3-phosphate acyltransferase|nr:lysophospholipid acyltransferase family protein [Spirochaetia bacterium]